MNKLKKYSIRILPIMFVIMIMIAKSSWGSFTNISPDVDVPTEATSMDVVISRVWGVVLVSLQVAAIAALVFAGVRYMYASADQRAELKKSLSYLAIGAILVFGASTVIGFVTNTFKELI